MNPETPESVLERVREILVAVLSVSVTEIRPEARLIEDLGAESIDLLDLRFRLEKAFGFRITDQDLSAAFGRDITPEQFRARFTVEALCGYVRERLERAHG